jgi:hypothetical protein
MTDRELMQMAIDALEQPSPIGGFDNQAYVAKALRDRLAQPEPEPVAWGNKKGEFKVHQEADDAFKSTAIPFYTAPPKREWVGLTEDEALYLLPVGEWEVESTLVFAKAIEDRLKDMNT